MVQTTHNPDERWLLVSDGDETLFGDDAALRRLIKAAEPCPQLGIAINSSRPIGSLRRTLEELHGRGLALAHEATITAMGTEICIDGEAVMDWTLRFEGWDRQVIDRAMQQLGHPAHAPELQAPFKASFAVPPESQDRARHALEEAGMPVRIIASGESDFDVLPPGAGKGAATIFLAEQLGVPLEHLVVAGDSANDLEMFRVSTKGIVVGNARPELRSVVEPGSVYFARGHRALGVLEGLQEYGALPRTAA